MSTPFPALSIPSFDLSALKTRHASPAAYRAACLHLGKAAERAERWEDVMKFVKEIMRCSAQDNIEMSEEERNLLYFSYKNIFHALRTSYKLTARAQYHAAAYTMQQQQLFLQLSNAGVNNAATANLALPPFEEKFPELLDDYRIHHEQQLQVICSEITSLMENTVVKTAQTPGCKVHLSKMCGDYYRYCSEVLHDKSLRLQFEKKCFEHYSYALKLAHAHLPPNHPYRLGVSLNYSVTLYEILKDRKQAVDLAKNAFDSAIHLLDSLDEQQYKDSTLTMQLLRDNLTLWIAQEEQFQLAQQQQQQGGGGAAVVAGAAAPQAQAQAQAQAQQQATGRTTVPAK